ncbi:SagB/ThcOx family dehydrogenase [Streptomyces orinoci]|uniref:SagB/ThcOx family dehydrogenase n=1 Tax=Streptomyces orinoci TaxID=67339 RepID=A0ABV3JRS6_STRON|nr:SagB/ThcOx family dehydrogenase [Streptomyces orinoci]
MADPLRCVTEQGYAVRTVPLPLFVRAYAAALVPPASAREVLDLRATPIPMLDVAVAADRRTALWQLAERAAALRLRRAAGPLSRCAVGAAPTREEAVCRAVYGELARRHRPTGQSRKVSCPPVPALREVAGRLDCHRTGDVAGVPAFTAVVRLERAAQPWTATVCDLSEERGVERAVWAALRAFVIDSLGGRDDAAALPGRPVRAAAPGAVSLAGAMAGRGPAQAVGVLPDDGAGDSGLAPSPPDELGELAEIRARLRRSGYRATATLLSPAATDTPGHVVGCRIVPGDSGVAAPVHEDPPPGLRAPVQLSLAYERDQVRISRVFHENSKMRTVPGGLPLVDLAQMAPRARRLLGLAYRDFGHTRRQYPLRPAGDPELLPLDICVRRRRSWAPMGSRPLDRDQLAHLLSLSYAVTGSADAREGLRLPLRATPSAGGLYSSDLFLLAENVTGIERGLYYFHPGKCALQLVDGSRTLAEVAEYTGYRDRVAGAAALVIYVGAFRRNQWKYRERGYRTVLLDCGHLAQSVVTNATALGLVAHPMIAFIDDYFNDFVGVDGSDDAVLYLTLLGTRKEERNA